MKYDKLVRDKIPEIIKKDGLKPIVHIANDEEYYERLLEKLKEELKEFIEDDNVKELADVLELIHAICEYKETSYEEIEKIRLRKKKKRGGFDLKIVLEEVTE